ncbi:MAG: hypothetical protein IKG56_04425 [Clostridia bacterium]|nr:hypothetical protein [Clostridia bacterium]
MGSYYIPSNKLKGENRILYIFTGKSLIYTAVGGFIGFFAYLIFTLLQLKTAGILVLAIFALIGYGIGTIKMPTSGTSKLVKNVGGDSIDEIIVHYMQFKKNKKVYTYSIPRKEPSYADTSVTSPLVNFITGKTNSDSTKEENK